MFLAVNQFTIFIPIKNTKILCGTPLPHFYIIHSVCYDLLKFFLFRTVPCNRIIKHKPKE